MINKCILNSHKNSHHKNSHNKQNVTDIYYLILRSWNIIPGSDNVGNIDSEIFSSWIQDVNQLCSNNEQNKLAQYFLGNLLGKFAFNQGCSNWLPQIILEFLDDINNITLRDSFFCALLNARGVTTRTLYEGGTQERELVAKYSTLSNKYKLMFPRVSKLLSDIAQNYKNEAMHNDNTTLQLQRWAK